MPKRSDDGKPKRGNGEGSITYDSKRDRYRVRVYTAEGKRIGDYKSKQDANTALRKALQARDEGTLIDGPKPTVAQFLAYWLEHSAKPTVRERTYEGYEGIIRLHVTPRIGKVRLHALNPQHVQTLQNALLKAGKSPRTIHNVRNVLSGALDQAEKWRWIARNPVRLVDAPRVPHEERAPITPEQVHALLDVVQGDRLEALYTVALALGLRRGEALGLKWEDIDLETGVNHVRRALQRLPDSGLRLLELKTKKSRRDIALPEAALIALRAHRDRQTFEREARLSHGLPWHDTGLVFTSRIGTPLEPRNATRSFQQVLKKAGLPHQRFHDLRHACATLLLAQGEELKVVQEVLGHSSYNTTADIYAHVLPQLKRQAAARMDLALTRRTGS